MCFQVTIYYKGMPKQELAAEIEAETIEDMASWLAQLLSSVYNPESLVYCQKMLYRHV